MSVKSLWNQPIQILKWCAYVTLIKVCNSQVCVEENVFYFNVDILGKKCFLKWVKMRQLMHTQCKWMRKYFGASGINSFLIVLNFILCVVAKRMIKLRFAVWQICIWILNFKFYWKF